MANEKNSVSAWDSEIPDAETAREKSMRNKLELQKEADSRLINECIFNIKRAIENGEMSTICDCMTPDSLISYLKMGRYQIISEIASPFDPEKIINVRWDNKKN